jgi:hypothetical protein
MTPSPESAFSQVPTEVWDQILSNPEWDHDSLLTLALVSKVVYHRCLLMLLARLGIKRETLEQRIELSLGVTLEERNRLYILGLPYVLDRTEEFVCYFPHDKFIAGSPLGFQYRIHWARALLFRLGSVKKVTLSFTVRQPTLKPSRQVDAFSEGPSNALQLLFDTMLQKGVEVLEIHAEGQYFLLPPPPPRSTPGAGAMSTLRKLLPSSRRETQRGVTRVVPGPSSSGDSDTMAGARIFSDDAKSKTRLGQINIKSTGSSVVPLAMWIYAVASISPVTSVSISYKLGWRDELQEVTVWPFSKSLPRAAPNITHLQLCIWQAIPTTKMLNRYLTAFSSLTHLQIVHDGLCFHRQPICPVLPQLVNLCVSGEWFRNVFPIDGQSYYLPKLRAVTIAFAARDARHPALPAYSKLAAIFHKRGGVPLEVTLEVVLGRGDWLVNPLSSTDYVLDSSTEIMKSRRCVSVIKLALLQLTRGRSGCWVDDDDFDKWERDSFSLRPLQKWFGAFENLRSVIVEPCSWYPTTVTTVTWLKEQLRPASSNWKQAWVLRDVDDTTISVM